MSVGLQMPAMSFLVFHVMGWVRQFVPTILAFRQSIVTLNMNGTNDTATKSICVTHLAKFN